jgi:transposase-like protein
MKKRHQLSQSDVITNIPLACSDELAAVEFMENQRWGKTPGCVHCGSVEVYKMTDKAGQRNKRFLWRCQDCGKQYTVRIGTVYEESRIELRHWCYAFRQFDFIWNHRQLNDGERVVRLIRSAEGRRLRYRAPEKRAADDF